MTVQYPSLKIFNIQLHMVLALVYPALSRGWTGQSSKVILFQESEENLNDLFPSSTESFRVTIIKLNLSREKSIQPRWKSQTLNFYGVYRMLTSDFLILFYFIFKEVVSIWWFSIYSYNFRPFKDKWVFRKYSQNFLSPKSIKEMWIILLSKYLLFLAVYFNTSLVTAETIWMNSHWQSI